MRANMSPTMSMNPRQGGVPGTGGEVDLVDCAAKYLETVANKDQNFTSLYRCLVGSEQGVIRPVSGFQDHDYPPVIERGLMPKDLFSTLHTAPIPQELQDLLNQPESEGCNMGLFPEIYRAWMTIGSDLYLWDFRDGTDLSFYDGLKETILSMSLVKVRPNVFRPTIKYLLCVSSVANVYLLGIITSTTSTAERPMFELIAQPIFVLSSDEARFNVITGSEKGRIFLGADDGTLHEIGYQSERGWLSDRYWKTNLTKSMFSSILPKFLTSSSTDPLEQIEVDNARRILYTRSAAGTVSAYDLGSDGNGFRSIGSMSLESMITNVMRISKNTLEPNFLRKIIGIGVIEAGELNLVAIADSGCRLYFTLYSPPENGNRGLEMRPQVFQLIHVRMQPGYCPTSATRKPPAGHFALLSQGVYSFVTRINPEQDAIWIIVPLIYSQQYCAEVCYVQLLPGLAIDVRPVPITLSNGADISQLQLPDSIIQHLAWSRQIVVLTASGTVVYKQSKPYELVRDLLLERKGAENIKGHFELTPNREQPLANVVLLASHPYHLEQQVVEQASKAFFMYGTVETGNPRPTGSPNVASPFGGRGGQGFHDSTIDFHPDIVSTPNRDRTRMESMHDALGIGSPRSPVGMTSFNSPYSPAGHPAQMYGMGPYSPQESSSCYTPRHDALYLVVSRILLPIWHEQLIKIVTVEDQENLRTVAPNISGEEVAYASSFLTSVLNFINNHPSLYISRVNVTPNTMNAVDARRAISQEVEKNSIAALRSFISITLEVLGMWKILCDHQFNVVLHGVDDRLYNCTMKELVVNGYGVVAIIINALVSKYLGDNAAVDAISLRLRKVCPTLFKNEDAIGSKVAEILAKVKIVTDKRDRESMLEEGIKLCEEICGHGRINIRNFCKQFAELGYPQGAVRLCLGAAKAADPNHFALVATKQITSSDSGAIQAFQKRMDIYKIVFELLDNLITTAAQRRTAQAPKEVTTPEDQLSAEKAKEHADIMIRTILGSDDETFHIALYNWLMDRKLFDRILEIKHPFLDSFLQRAADAVVSGQWPADTPGPNDTRVLDLLWRHHEMNHNYLAAAQILSKLSESTTTNLLLGQRIEYLARAIICCKCCSAQGELLEQLEAKLEVAQIQKSILEWVQTRIQTVQNTVEGSGDDGSVLIDTRTLQELSNRLNSQLYNITQLYADYAVPLKLHDIRLAIFHSAGHCEKQLIETLWAEIIEAEVHATDRHSVESQMEIIGERLVVLGRKYRASPNFFPVEYLVEHLESMKPTENVDAAWVFKTMLSVGVPFTELLLVYERLWRKLVSRNAAGPSADTQVASVIVLMIGMFAYDKIDIQLTAMQRAELVEKCKDLVSQMLIEFSSRFDASAKEVHSNLTHLKDRIDRIYK